MDKRSQHLVHLVDELKVGGAQTHLLNLIRHAKPYGVRHTVVSLFGSGPLVSEFEAIGARVVTLDFRPALKKRHYFGIYRALYQFFKSEKPDIVEAHLTWSRLFGLPAAYFAGIPKRFGFEQGDLFFNGLKWRVFNFLGQFFANRIIVCSEWLRDWVHHTHGVSRARLWVLHNCLDTTLFDGKPKSDKSRTKDFPQKKYLIASVGSLGTGIDKHTEVTLKALAIAVREEPELGMIVCGDGEKKVWLEELASKLGIKENVRFLGNRRDLPQLLRQCTMFCHAAPFEPFGIVCLEAMACGLPVLIPNTGGMKEITPDNAAGLHYPSLNSQALAECMLRLCEEPHTRKRMQRRGKEIVEKKFNVEDYLEELYTGYGIGRLEAAPLKTQRV